MMLYVKALALSLIASAVMITPFLAYYGLPWFEIVGLTALAGALGPLVSLRHNTMFGVDKSRKEEWTYVCATYIPVFMLILQAVIWTAFRYSDTGHVSIDSTGHIVAVVSAVGAFTLWIWMAAFFYKRRPNQSSQRNAIARPISVFESRSSRG